MTIQEKDSKPQGGPYTQVEGSLEYSGNDIHGVAAGHVKDATLIGAVPPLKLLRSY